MAGAIAALDALRAGRRVREPVAVVVAHPDDETIGLGPLLARFDDLRLIHVTDGSPPNGVDARAHGFPDPEAYARARASELDRALALAGVWAARPALAGLPVPDQTASFRMAAIAAALRPALAPRRIVFTHPHEGGHPDHDAVALAVRLVCPDDDQVAEFACYHDGPDGALAVGCFADDPVPVTAVALDDAAVMLRERMLDAHASQNLTLAPFRGIRALLFRPRPEVEPSLRLPAGARYDRFSWGIGSAEWRTLARGVWGPRARPPEDPC